MNQKVAVGIDLGTTHCCVAVMRLGKVEIIENDMNSKITPSYVAFTESGCLIGATAKSQANVNLSDTIFNVKQMIGQKFDDLEFKKKTEFWPFMIKKKNSMVHIKAGSQVKKKLYTPEEISAIVLTKLKQIAEDYLEQDIKNVVVSVPAHFNHIQREATKEAGSIAGLDVLDVINEPTAAAVTYALTKEIKGNILGLFFDFGGSKLDVSIVNIRAASVIDIEVKSTASDNNLGGTDLDRLVVKHLIHVIEKQFKKDIRKDMKAIRRLYTEWEKAKIILSSNKETLISIDSLCDGFDFIHTITRETFEDVCDELLASIIYPVERALLDAQLHKQKIDEIILVGGSTRVPKVQKILSDFWEGKTAKQIS
uniref:Uncharacterized protein n=1 Tax=Biomphalaria glabrata TaxID=6526 RepID=A0A2C9K9Y2_BIOGL